jgi:aminomethyltransferase
MTLKRTPLYHTHVKLGARIVEFGGWEMPVQYTGILEEHKAVRQRAGLFDICHMGEIKVQGEEALPFLQHVLTNDPALLSLGQAQYNLLCNEKGGALDDLIVYRTGEDRYLLVVNASNSDKDYGWLDDHRQEGMTVENLSDRTGLLALQGPRAEAILQQLTEVALPTLAYYHCAEGRVAGLEALIARSGYTGEDGFEIMVPSEHVVELWEALMEAGREEGLAPVGLGARDTLRLEAAMPLYGHELDETTNPLEAGLGRFVNWDKGDFIGREVMLRAAPPFSPPKVGGERGGVRRKLIGFQMVGRGIPRSDYEIAHQGQVVGRVTSGSYAPTLEAAIGMGYVPPELARPGTKIEVLIRGRPVRAEVVRKPFYRRPGKGSHG